MESLVITKQCPDCRQEANVFVLQRKDGYYFVCTRCDAIFREDDSVLSIAEIQQIFNVPDARGVIILACKALSVSNNPINL
jgi:hypothetical protein